MPTMSLAFVLELYQPPTQTFGILNQINRECYIPLGKLLVSEPQIRMTLSFTSSLSNLFEHYGISDQINSLLTTGAVNGNIELTHSGAYHSVFPLLSHQEIRRQIELDIIAKTKSFALTNKGGIISPELSYNDSLIPIFKKMGFSWTIIDDKLMSLFDISVHDDSIYQLYGVSLLMRSSLWSDRIREPRSDNTHWTGRSFIEEMQRELEHKGYDCYKIIMLPGETFGHHIKYFQEFFLRDMLFALNDYTDIKLCTVSDLHGDNRFAKIEKTSAENSHFKYFPSGSISTNSDDWNRGDYYPHFNSHGNSIHKKLWALTDLILQVTERIDFSIDEHIILREKLDKAFYSGQYYNASIWFWDKENVYEGIDLQMRALYQYVRITEDNESLRKGQKLYTELMWAIHQRDTEEEKKRKIIS